MHLESSYHMVHFSSHSVGSVTQSKLTAEQIGFHQLNKHLIIKNLTKSFMTQHWF